MKNNLSPTTVIATLVAALLVLVGIVLYFLQGSKPIPLDGPPSSKSKSLTSLGFQARIVCDVAAHIGRFNLEDSWLDDWHIA
jgi:hypothetical protein